MALVVFLVLGCGSEAPAESRAQDAGTDAALGLFGEQCIKQDGTPAAPPGQCEQLKVECGDDCDVYCTQVVAHGPRYCLFTCQGEGCEELCAEYGGKYNPLSFACSP